MKVAPVHVLLACTYTPIRFLPQVALETGCKLCADTWAILMSSTRLESRCTISPPPYPHPHPHTCASFEVFSSPSPTLSFTSLSLPSAPLCSTSPFPSPFLRTKLFIRFPKTLFDTEDLFQQKKNDLGK